MKPTGYERYSQTQLHTLFSTGAWDKLDLGARVRACQEVENRYAAECGVAPLEVRLVPMEGGVYGSQRGETLRLNASLVGDGTFRSTDTGPDGREVTHEVRVDAPGWNVLDTVYHEGTHGVQEAQGRAPTTYVMSDTDEDLYRIQGVEKEAFHAGQVRTLRALQEVEAATGREDLARKAYLRTVQSDSFEEALRSSVRHYGDPNVEETLADVIADRERGIVPEQPSPSYRAINDLCDEQYQRLVAEALGNRAQAVEGASQSPAAVQAVSGNGRLQGVGAWEGRQDGGRAAAPGASQAFASGNDGAALGALSASSALDDGATIGLSGARPSAGLDDGSEPSFAPDGPSLEDDGADLLSGDVGPAHFESAELSWD